MRTQTRGFTLIDLVVVIAIVVILAVLIVPSLQRATELANQAACGANLNGMGKALALYRGQDQNDRFPLLFTTGQPEANIRASDAGGSLDQLRANLVGREAAMQNVWPAIDQGLITEDAFHCPSDYDFRPRTFESAALRKQHRFGWQSSANFSYGMHFRTGARLWTAGRSRIRRILATS